MNLRTQYSLRQALPVALFGLPLYGLEVGLGRVVGVYDLELIPSILGGVSLVGFPLLGVFTFVRAYDRFDLEFSRQQLVRRRPFSVVRLVLNWALLSVFWFGLMAVSVGAAGLPTNQEGWARLGITGLGLFFGLCLLKCIYLDWVEKLNLDGGNPDSMGKPVPTGGPRRTRPALTPRGKSAHTACRVWF